MHGTVNEVVTISTRSDNGARGVVNLPATHGLTCVEALAQERDRGVARIPDRQPDSGVSLARRTERPHPRLISEDTILFACPEIYEKNVATLDGRGVLRCRLIVRIGRVRADRDDRAMVRFQSSGFEALPDPLLERVLSHW